MSPRFESPCRQPAPRRAAGGVAPGSSEGRSGRPAAFGSSFTAGRSYWPPRPEWPVGPGRNGAGASATGRPVAGISRPHRTSRPARLFQGEPSFRQPRADPSPPATRTGHPRAFPRRLSRTGRCYRSAGADFQRHHDSGRYSGPAESRLAGPDGSDPVTTRLLSRRLRLLAASRLRGGCTARRPRTRAGGPAQHRDHPDRRPERPDGKGDFSQGIRREGADHAEYGARGLSRWYRVPQLLRHVSDLLAVEGVAADRSVSAEQRADRKRRTARRLGRLADAAGLRAGTCPWRSRTPATVLPTSASS